MAFDAQAGLRLKQERARLKLTQQQAADAVGIRREMWNRYERGLAAPGGDVLAGWADLGIEPFYVLTGRRFDDVPAIASVLSPREEALLDNYRHSGEEGKKALEVSASALAKQKASGG